MAMRLTMKEAHWTAIAALAAAIAAIAGTVQAYVSWRGRDDVLKATMLSAFVQRRSESSAEAANFLLTIRTSNDKNEFSLAFRHFVEKATGTLVLGSYKRGAKPIMNT